MYQLSLLTDGSKKFLQEALNVMTNNNKTTIALAKVISDRLPMPSNEVDEVSQYFINSCLGMARAYVSQINEIRVIDMDKVLDLVRTFWDIRYKLINPKKNIYFIGGATIESHLYGYATSYNSSLVTAFENDTMGFVTFYNGLSGMLSDLNPGEDNTI
jgi:hypothetical protein